MKKIIGNIFTFLIALTTLGLSILWGINSNWDYEPVILIIVSGLEIISFLVLKISNNESESEKTQSIKQVSKQDVVVSVNLGAVPAKVTSEQPDKTLSSEFTRESQIEYMKSKYSILFIDDDKNFNVVKILKNSGWKKTKTVTDINGLDVILVKEANILFVDINGVGKQLNLEYEGLDLALMLKQKYPEKKVVIYSANKNSNSFHKAWDSCDFKLEKNALPYQFQSLVEQYSLESYNNSK